MKNQKGSVLIWAVVIILIFSVFAAAALIIANSMSERSIRTRTERQLYLTARSAATVVAQEMTSSRGTVLINELVSKKPAVQTVDNFFPDDKNMGKCSVYAKCNTEASQIIVTATAKQNGITATVSAIVVKDGTKWVIAGYDGKDINAKRN